ncbi:MAG: hypothetical protein JWN70_788 [Planctomycetaceae bacterium]|nr:hypothetical protein [Planctomycetaceae bacterium]
MNFDKIMVVESEPDVGSERADWVMISFFFILLFDILIDGLLRAKCAHPNGNDLTVFAKCNFGDDPFWIVRLTSRLTRVCRASDVPSTNQTRPRHTSG